MRKIALIIIAVLAVVILALAIVPRFLDVNRYRGQILSELQKRLGRPVTLGEMSASLLPPALRVKDVTVGEDQRFGSGPFATSQELDVRVALLPLLHKDVQIQSLRLINPNIELIRDSSGVWNYSTLGQPATASQAPSSAPSKPSAGTPQSGGEGSTAPALSLEYLQIDNGKVRMVDQQKKSDVTYENIDVTLKNFVPGKPFDVDATVHVAGKDNQEIRVKGTAGPLTGGNALPAFDGTVDLKKISVADLRRVANVPALDGYNGEISGSLKATSQNGVVNSEGSLKVDDPQIKTTKLGYPITLDYKLSDSTKDGVIRIENGTLHLGPTPLSIAGSVNTTPTPSQLDLRVVTSGASISEFARLAAAMGVAFNAGSDISGKLNADIAARGAANNPALNGNLRASDVQISGGTIKQPVSVPEIELALSPAMISSNQFSAKTGSTLLNAKFNLKDYTTQAPTVQATLQTNNASVGELLAIASAYGVSAVEGMNGSGSLTLNLTAAGPLKNTSAMVFNGSGRLVNASLTMPSLTKPVNVKNAEVNFSQNTMALNNLAVSLDQTNATGSIAIRNFAAPQLQFHINADKLDLAALQQIVVSTPPAKQAAIELLPRANAATPPEPSLLSKAVGSGDINAGLITYDQLALNNVKSEVTLDHGLIRMAPLTSSLYGGAQSGQIVLDTRATPPVVTISSKLQKVDANKLISSVSSLKETIYGMLAANANSSFRAGSSADIAKTLNGTLSLDLSNGKIAKIDLLNQLASIGKFVNSSLAPQQPFTDVTKLTGTFNVVNGQAQTNDLRAVIPGANLAATGLVNLATNALNMHLTAVLSKDFSQKAGGTGIGGFMQTALANKNGELVMPILVTGTFDHPSFAPDVQSIAQMKLQNLVPSFGNPGNMGSSILGQVLGGKKGQGQAGGLSGIVGAITGQQSNQGQAAQTPAATEDQQKEQPDDNPLGNLVNQVMGGKKKKQPAQKQAQEPK
jgi:uncharacterized protein involved in outer membrane biogenesis